MSLVDREEPCRWEPMFAKPQPGRGLPVLTWPAVEAVLWPSPGSGAGPSAGPYPVGSSLRQHFPERAGEGL